ncbi:MAG: thioredoxin family protein [Bacteroidales bacterium]|nr:thioredoxin family protein [Bacteroidales bacterium]
MKQKITLTLILGLLSLSLSAQQAVKIYNPDADAKKEIASAVTKASAEGKHVFLQIGGNWCPWCVRFHKMVTEDLKLDSLMKANYEVVKVNYSKENTNHEFLATLGYPQRFGFPVFVILDGTGKVLHTQDSGYLEEDKGYSQEKVERLLINWSALTMKEAAAKYGK